MTATIRRWMRAAPGRWARACALSTAERGALARALVLVPAMALALRCLGYRRTLALVQGRTDLLSGASVSPGGWSELQRLARMVDVAARRGIPGGTCLAQSLALLFLMGRAGWCGRLVIGSRREQGEFRAHAWVECDGRAVNDDPDVVRQFAAFRELAVW